MKWTYCGLRPIHNKHQQGGLPGGREEVIACLRCDLILLILFLLLSFFLFLSFFSSSFFGFVWLNLTCSHFCLSSSLAVSLTRPSFLSAFQSGGNIRGIRLA